MMNMQIISAQVLSVVKNCTFPSQSYCCGPETTKRPPRSRNDHRSGYQHRVTSSIKAASVYRPVKTGARPESHY